ncbi:MULTISPECIES: hypothetical protein [unclassified Pantoea]|uniref:hypothetical protein n=1 Tax=unclassified Pantoea TaxID=2630326 RepID=UPI001CD7389E|nr:MULTISPECIES: hypothetical protein [unclassified Pantoea]MCA1179507.1 hypothetical protein [Pantoea sp. alder69]MCA1251760.1 hypothetical protein [Pantoea sp. alder70]MCA1267903.1 hypothetical protein [Pantoea sp. alder81]
MISIKKHLISTGKMVDDLLKEKSESLWVYLSDSAKRTSIIKDAEKLLKKVNTKKHSKIYTLAASKRHVSLMEHITKQDKLKEIITAQPADFENLKLELRSFLACDDYQSPNKKKKIKPFSDILLSDVFKYKQYRDSVFCSKLYIDLNFLQVTCPYCNEYPVKILQRLDKTSKKPLLHFDLDHFYPKNLHPYFALSFYNHIPSCKYCNSLHKGVKDFSTNTHIHPFSHNFDEHYTFKFSHGIILDNPIRDVVLDKTSNFGDQLCTDLDLEERYKSNIGYANLNRLVELLTDNSHILGEKSYEKNKKDIDLLKERLTDFGLKFDGNKILERPWSKMQRDLVKFIDVHNHLSMEN